MEQARKLKAQGQYVHEEKMTILALACCRTLVSNIEMKIFSNDGLSLTVIYPCQWSNKTEQICYHGLAAVYCTMLAWTKRKVN
jgi:hypothetical protein